MREKKSKSTEEKTSNIGTTKKEKIVKKCKICEALDKVLDKVNNYFFVPFLLILGLTLLGQYYKESTFGLVVNIMLTAVFFAWIAIIIYKLCRRLTKIAIIWPLIVSLVALITSFITLFAKEAFASNLAFIIGIIFMEAFLIYLIVCDAYDNKNRLSRVIISSILFVTLGYVTIFYLSYGLENKTIFNSLISIFLAIVGGGLTLGGVAWTIKHEKQNRKDEEKLKAKPIVFICDYDNLNHEFENPIKKNMVSRNNLGTLLRANKRNKSYSIPKIIISNSDYSYVVIRGFRINNDYHIFDFGQVLAKNSIVEMVRDFSFKYKNRIKNVPIVMQDILDNLYEIVVNYKIVNEGNCKTIKILSGIEIIESDLDLKGRI